MQYPSICWWHPHLYLLVWHLPLHILCKLSPPRPSSFFTIYVNGTFTYKAAQVPDLSVVLDTSFSSFLISHSLASSSSCEFFLQNILHPDTAYCLSISSTITLVPITIRLQLSFLLPPLSPRICSDGFLSKVYIWSPFFPHKPSQYLSITFTMNSHLLMVRVHSCLLLIIDHTPPPYCIGLFSFVFATSYWTGVPVTLALKATSYTCSSDSHLPHPNFVLTPLAKRTILLSSLQCAFQSFLFFCPGDWVECTWDSCVRIIYL